jgi:hypothetical protein
MTKFLRTHSSGTDVLVNQSIHGWRIHINLREPTHTPMTIAGFVGPTLESAKLLADKELLKFGHVCSGSCKDWVEVHGAPSFSRPFDKSRRFRSEHF